MAISELELETTAIDDLAVEEDTLELLSFAEDSTPVKPAATLSSEQFIKMLIRQQRKKAAMGFFILTPLMGEP